MVLKEKWERLETVLFKKKWFTCLLLVLAALGIGVLALAFASADARMDMLDSYFKRPWTVVLNLLPPVLFALLLWFLTNRAVVAYGCTAVLFFALALANWYKLYFRNDPLLFGDLFLWQEAGNMLGNYHLFMTPSLALSLFVIVAGGVVVFFCGRGRFQGPRVRLPLAGAVLLAAVPLAFLYNNSAVYSQMENYDHVPRWSETGAYISRGFVYSFLRSTFSAFETVPEGYNKKEAQALLAQFEEGSIPADKQVDVMGIMLEAFNDFSKYPQIPFVQDPYGKFHELEAESFTGDLVTNIFAGGTINTEQSFLTGLRDLGNMRSRTNSYAWYLRSQGYGASGSHPCYAWFYNRQNVNPNMGLYPYYFQENYYGLVNGEFAPDSVAMPAIVNLYRQQAEESGAPQFSFSVTYQGHGPYETGRNVWGEDFVQPGVYSQETENICNNYFGSVHSTGEALWEMVDGLRGQERPVVLVVFGDHNPWMGDGNSAYKEMGIEFDRDTQEGFMDYYSTRYLIWANDAARELLGDRFTGEGPAIAPCFLMNQVFELCGWQGPAYMQYTTQLMEEFPVVHGTGAVLDRDGVLLEDLEGEVLEKIREFERVEYYMRHEFLYEDAAG